MKFLSRTSECQDWSPSPTESRPWMGRWRKLPLELQPCQLLLCTPPRGSEYSWLTYLLSGSLWIEVDKEEIWAMFPETRFTPSSCDPFSTARLLKQTLRPRHKPLVGNLNYHCWILNYSDNWIVIVDTSRVKCSWSTSIKGSAEQCNEA